MELEKSGVSSLDVQNADFTDNDLKSENNALPDLIPDEIILFDKFTMDLKESLQKLENAQEMMIVDGVINEIIANTCIELENEIEREFKEIFEYYPNIALDVAKTHYILEGFLNSFLMQ